MTFLKTIELFSHEVTAQSWFQQLTAPMFNTTGHSNQNCEISNDSKLCKAYVHIQLFCYYYVK